VIRVITERRPNLAAIHDELVTIANRSCLHITEVGAMVWLRETLTPDFFSGQNVFDVTLAIFLGTHVE